MPKSAATASKTSALIVTLRDAVDAAVSELRRFEGDVAFIQADLDGFNHPGGYNWEDLADAQDEVAAAQTRVNRARMALSQAEADAAMSQ